MRTRGKRGANHDDASRGKGVVGVVRPSLRSPREKARITLRKKLSQLPPNIWYHIPTRGLEEFESYLVDFESVYTVLETNTGQAPRELQLLMVDAGILKIWKRGEKTHCTFKLDEFYELWVEGTSFANFESNRKRCTNGNKEWFISKGKPRDAMKTVELRQGTTPRLPSDDSTAPTESTTPTTASTAIITEVSTSQTEATSEDQGNLFSSPANGPYPFVFSNLPKTPKESETEDVPIPPQESDQENREEAFFFERHKPRSLDTVIEDCLNLDFDKSPRPSRIPGDPDIQVQKRSRMDELHRTQAVWIATRLGWHTANSPRRRLIEEAAVRIVAYDHGYRIPKGVTTISKWLQESEKVFDHRVSLGSHPMDKTRKGNGRLTFGDRVDSEHPGLLVKLFREAIRTVGIDASFEDLAAKIRQLSIDDEAIPSLSGCTKATLRQWFKKHNGKSIRLKVSDNIRRFG